MRTPGHRFITNSATTSAFIRPTSFCRNKNCLFKFVKSIVSISIRWMFRIPDTAKFFTISQPSPPAPTTKISYSGIVSKKDSYIPSIGFYMNGDGFFKYGSKLLNIYSFQAIFTCSRGYLQTSG